MHNGHHRTSVSRSYYAAYQCLTGALSQLKDVKSGFAYQQHNPMHKKLKGLIEHLPRNGVSQNDTRTISRQFNNLLKARVQADYYPEVALTPTDARERYREASNILRSLRVLPGE